MEHLLYYLLRASVSMALFYGFYKLFIAKNTFHAINRFLLIAIALLATILPLFRFNLIPDWNRVTLVENIQWDISSIPVLEISVMTAPQPMLPWRELLMVILITGFLFAFVRYLIGLVQIIGIIRNTRKEKLTDNTTLCLTDKDIAPFSWMNYVVLPDRDLLKENQAIIQHEQAHIHLRHSFDMIFLDLFTSVFWFNPFSWLLRREIQSVHEYQADVQVLNEGIEIKQYQLLLIRKSVGEQKFALANNFRHRDLHKRIAMMMKNKNDNQMKWSYTAILPVLLLVMVALSVPRLNAGIPEKATEDYIVTTLKEGESIVLPEEFVDLSNDSLELEKVRIVTKEDSISQSGKVREQADTTHAQGIKIEHKKMEDVKVIRYGSMKGKEPISAMSVQGVGSHPLYILDGKEVESLSDIDPNLIEAIEVLKNSYATEKYGERGNDGVIFITTKKGVKAAFVLDGEEPLLILDGEIQDAAFDLNSVSPDDIDSISVLKGQSALEFYGEKGKNGVIVITRKKATN